MRRKSFFAGLIRVVELALVALLGSLVVLVAADTALWFLLELSSPVVAEVQSILQIWFGFLAAAAGVRYGSHLSMNLVADRFSRGARLGLNLGVRLFEVTLGLLFVVHGAQLIRTVSNTLPGLGIGASSQYVPALVGGVLIVIFALEKLFAPASEDSNRAPEGSNNG